ncbi:MAG TPA: glycosyltransferase family protein, partial [Candidatus Nanoarchaeia archaeon]|nr:glycosyltransferase family protein [Candidatus Nanoarchaeia archaeon]
GGFTLISEALYLQKPILSIPVEGQFEQTLNALYLKKLGYGVYAKKTTREGIEAFLGNLPLLKKYLKKYKKHTNKDALGKIENSVRLLMKRPAISRARSWRRHRDCLRR